jgi:putative hemolysin
LREVSRQLGIELPDEGSWTTLAGLVLHLAGGMPKAGDEFSLENGVTLHVVEATPRRVKSIRVSGVRSGKGEEEEKSPPSA